MYLSYKYVINIYLRTLMLILLFAHYHLLCRLECESGFYFDMDFFEEMVLDGNWDEVESYLSSFTKPDDNRYSNKIFFEIRKQKFLEALDG